MLGLKGFISIMSADAFTSTATIGGQGATLALIYDHVESLYMNEYSVRPSLSN